MTNYEEVKVFFQKNDRLGQYLGIEIDEVREGFSRTRVRLRPELLNGANIAHGGTIFALADIAFGVAANSKGELAIGIEAHISYIRPGKSGTLYAEAKEIGQNSRTSTYQVTVLDEAKQVLAQFQGTAFKKKERLF
ncbi:MAG: PaaI family thioesterase [Desulfonatronovibrionaceae bacterium]